MLRTRTSAQHNHFGAFDLALLADPVPLAKAIPKAERDAIGTIRIAPRLAELSYFAVQSTAAYLRGRLGLAALGEAKVLAALLEAPGEPVRLAKLAQITGFKPASAKVAASKLRGDLRRLGIEHHLHGGAVSGLVIDCDADALLEECESRNGVQPAAKSALVELIESALRTELGMARNAEARLLAKLVSKPGQPFTAGELTAAIGCAEVSLRCYVWHLRASLDRHGCLRSIQTIRQSGLSQSSQYVISARGYADLKRAVSPQLAEALEELRRRNAN